ncbi:voltage-gated potassium channel [Flavobacterium endophyticum]|uniref:Voltage-gated potassium channel n=1 Tax=Flavobacterium endophyticum TaxID=1540163 RepID=A0A495ME31_9FLAO|nr:ion transporter [Flavobacterium endophyticum]RKS23332.1 voltage-gated potassium channel [Flavobacterium endophyticum]
MEVTRIERIRKKLHEIIYEADTPFGKLFDVILLLLIIVSIISVMLESVASIRFLYGTELAIIEWIITGFFTLEYIGRIIAVKRPLKYIFSFYGIIDLLATLPAYIDLLFPGWHFLVSLRAVRLLRVFRILKLAHFVGASNQLVVALKKSRLKIAVFLFSVIVLCIILGTIMYMIEGPEHGFTSIPMSIYWTIVTLTTVGFGDITPATPFGQFVSMIIMILGYGIIAVPTGLVTAEFMSKDRKVHENTQVCPNCSADHHRDDAKFCYHCGHTL